LSNIFFRLLKKLLLIDLDGIKLDHHQALRMNQTTKPKGESIMSMMKEFKEFAMRGNVVDMAVGIIIGAAFGKIVSSFVNDVIMPPLGMVIGGVDFTELTVVLEAAQGDVAEVAIRYGMFLQNVVDFVIVAFAIVMAVKAMNTLKKKEETKPATPPPPPAPSNEEKLLAEIRDLLKSGK